MAAPRRTISSLIPVTLDDSREADLCAVHESGRARLAVKSRATGKTLRSDRVADAALLIDGLRRYVDANKAATRLLGYSRKELLAMRFGELSGARSTDAATIWARARENGVATGAHTLRAKDGRPVPIAFSIWTDLLPGFHLALVRAV